VGVLLLLLSVVVLSVVVLSVVVLSVVVVVLLQTPRLAAVGRWLPRTPTPVSSGWQSRGGRGGSWRAG
jgi:hypothetical protein